MATYTTWTTADASGWTDNNFGGADSLGLYFKVSSNAWCTGLRIWKASSSTTGPWNGRLYQSTSSSAGTQLGSLTITDTGTSGAWQEASFGSAIALTAGTWYVAVVDRGAFATRVAGYWVSGGGGFGGRTNGILVTPDVAASPYGGQDAFTSTGTAGIYPDSPAATGNQYGVDVTVSDTAPTPVLTLDAASPAVTVDGGAGSSGTTPYAFTSNSFTPPASSVVIVTYETGAAAGGVTYDTSGAWPTIADSLASHLTWHQFSSQVDNSASPNPHRLTAWWAYAGPASPGSMTVTCTDVATSGQISNGGTISVKIWDNANRRAPVGALLAASNSGSLATLSVSLTPTVTGSALFLAATVDSTNNSAAGSGMTVTDTSGAHYIQEWPGALTTSLTPVALTQTVSGGGEWQYIGYEVLPVTTEVVQLPPQQLAPARFAPLTRRFPVAPFDVPTGVLVSPPPSVTANAGLATGTGTAVQPGVEVDATSTGIATAAGAALAPVATVTANAGLATGTGAALQPGVEVDATSTGIATGTGSALQPSAAITVFAGLATGTGAAQQPVPAITVPAGLATGTGTALQPTVSTSGNTTANAGLATGTGAALSPAVTIAPNAGLAAGTGTAQAPVPAVTITAGLASGTGAALQPGPVVTALAGLATGTGAALQPSVSTSGNTTANAGLATGTGTSQAPVAQVTALAALATGTGAALNGQRIIPATLATGTGTAQAPGLTVLAQAAAAQALAQAYGGTVPAQHVPATSTSSVTDPRDGTATVTAAATSTSSVS